MNLKKTIALFILLLANVIMLAKPVACYLQYRDNNQITVAVCSTNGKHKCSKHTEQQNSSNTTHKKKCCDTEKCVLRNLFSPESSIKLPNPSCENSNIAINNILVCQTIQITDLTGLPFRQKPYTPLVYADFVSQSIGLRAPPAC